MTTRTLALQSRAHPALKHADIVRGKAQQSGRGRRTPVLRVDLKGRAQQRHAIVARARGRGNGIGGERARRDTAAGAADRFERGQGGRETRRLRVECDGRRGAVGGDARDAQREGGGGEEQSGQKTRTAVLASGGSARGNSHDFWAQFSARLRCRVMENGRAVVRAGSQAMRRFPLEGRVKSNRRSGVCFEQTASRSPVKSRRSPSASSPPPMSAWRRRACSACALYCCVCAHSFLRSVSPIGLDC